MTSKEVLAMYKSGKNVSEIMEETGLSRTHVYRLIHEDRLPPCTRTNCLMNTKKGSCRALIDTRNCKFFKDYRQMDSREIMRYEDGLLNGFRPYKNDVISASKAKEMKR